MAQIPNRGDKRTFFDITINGEPAGRIVFLLWNFTCPRTVEKFRALCTGELGRILENNASYEGSIFHRVIKGVMIQGGDITKKNGQGGYSITDATFDDENLSLIHNKPYLLSTVNRGPDTNGSQFFITTKNSPQLDGCVFGEVIEGFDVIRRIENLPTSENEEPFHKVQLVNCGEMIKKEDVIASQRGVESRTNNSLMRTSRFPSRERPEEDSRKRRRSWTPERRCHHKRAGRERRSRSRSDFSDFSSQSERREERRYFESSPTMPQTIQLKMGNKEILLESPYNTLTVSSIRSVFLVTGETIFSLSYEINGVKIYCRMDQKGTEFKLPLGFPKLQFIVNSNNTPSRPSIPDVVKETTSKTNERTDLEVSLPVNGDTISKVSKYAWFYTKNDSLKRSAIPVMKNLAITFRHGDNRELMIGDCIELQSYNNPTVIVETNVVKIDDRMDMIVLQSQIADLCDRDLMLEAVQPTEGMKYVLMGYSVMHSKTSQISFSSGIVSSDLTPRCRFLGSSGSFKGDSGGSCWNEYGMLIGMQVGTEKIPHTTDKSGRQSSLAEGGRCVFIPTSLIKYTIMEFLPPDEEFDWEE